MILNNIIKYLWLYALAVTIVLMTLSLITQKSTYAQLSFYSLFITIGIGLGIWIKNEVIKKW